MEEIKNQNTPPAPALNASSQGRSSKLPWVVSIILLIAILSLGYFVWQTQKKNKELNSAKMALEQEKSVMQTKISDLDASNKDIQSKLDEMSQNINTLEAEKKALEEKSSSTCVKENSCKFRTPGSEFRCDATSKYSPMGNSLCTCDIDCNVVKK